METDQLTRELRIKQIMERYQEPHSLPEAQIRLQNAWQEKQEIEIQLSDPERNAETTEFADPEWEKWRRRAVFNLKIQEAIIRFLKSWIINKRQELSKKKQPKEERQKIHEAKKKADAALANVDLADPGSLIKAAHLLLKKLAKETRVDYVVEEWALISSLENYLRNSIETHRDKE